MRVNLKSLRIFLFIVLLLYPALNGQNTYTQELDGLNDITEEQRSLLREAAQYFKEIREQKLSNISCVNGQNTLEYQLPSINPCITENNPEVLAKTLSSEKSKIERDKGEVEKKIERSEIEENSEIRELEKETRLKIENIRKLETSEIKSGIKSEKILTDAIKERADLETESERIKINQEIREIRGERAAERASLLDDFISLNRQEKTIDVNSTILFETNPNIKFSSEEKAGMRKITEVIKIEILQAKIAETKQAFLSLSSSSSESAKAQADEIFEAITFQTQQKKNFAQAEVIFTSLASSRQINIPIVIAPQGSAAVIRMRKCKQGGAYWEEGTFSEIVLTKEMGKYRIRARIGNNYKCFDYDGYDNKNEVKFDFNNNDEKICNPLDEVRDVSQRCP